MATQANIFPRRRYFSVNPFPYDCKENVVADFRKASIIAWTYIEYSEAIESLVTYHSIDFDLGFQVICIEQMGDRPLIESIMDSHKSHMRELSIGKAKTCDAFIEALGRLAQVEGITLVDISSRHLKSVGEKLQDLSLLLGIKELSGFSGCIERISEDFVYIRLGFPAATRMYDEFTAKIPISSCPALRRDEDESTASLTDKTSLRQMEDDALLRPYQTEQKNNILKAWQSARRVMLQMPTGTGKTRLFVSLIRDIKRQQPEARILIVAHRAELIEQTSLSLTLHYRLRHGILGKKNALDNSSILVASI